MGFDLRTYEPVEERLARFWADHPAGRVSTTLLPAAAGQYVVLASVWRDAADQDPAATGLAEERVTGSGVNATSALENCETSAIGRALANLGYAPKGARPSREEMVAATSARPPAPAEEPGAPTWLEAALLDATDRAALDDAAAQVAAHAGGLHPARLDRLRGLYRRRAHQLADNGPTTDDQL